MSEDLDGPMGLESLGELAQDIVERLEAQLPLLEDIHAACCEESEEPSPLIEMLKEQFGELRASIDRQTRAIDRLTEACRQKC